MEIDRYTFPEAPAWSNIERERAYFAKLARMERRRRRARAILKLVRWLNGTRRV